MQRDAASDSGPSALSDVLVVGAGLAGATAARALAIAGLRVTVLDKGRGPGGRLSTRRSAAAGFDHGATSVQASGRDFATWLDAEAVAGRAARWREGWVGVPGMDALVAGLLEGLDRHWSTTVAALSRPSSVWQAHATNGRLLAAAPRLVLAVPAPQARALLLCAAEGLPESLIALTDALATVRYAPCWAGLVVATAKGECPVLAEGSDAVLGGVFREAAKPGRDDAGHWVVHATADWSTAHLERDAEAVAMDLRAAFLRVTGIDDAAIRSCIAHRWRYAQPLQGIDPAPQVAGLVLAGDAIGADAGVPPAERAWHSGRDAAARLLAAQPFQPKS